MCMHAYPCKWLLLLDLGSGAETAEFSLLFKETVSGTAQVLWKLRRLACWGETLTSGPTSLRSQFTHPQNRVTILPNSHTLHED